MSNSHRISILRNVYRKLDGMMLSFGMPIYSDNMPDDIVERYVGMSLDDTLRELRLTDIDTIEEMSIAEYHIENRSVYHKLRLLRNASSVYFKFSTAVDGKTIDKSMIPKMLNTIIEEYDNEWKKWISEGGITGLTTGNSWNRTSSDGTSWYREMNG